MDKKYKYCIIEDFNIILFDKSNVSYSPLRSEFLENVSVVIDDRGVLTINGNIIEYDFYLDNKIFEKEWHRIPDSKLIHEGKRHFWSKYKEKYIKGGWVKTIERTPVTYIFNKYKIEILK